GSFTFSTTTAVPAGQLISATATRPDGSTSEFSSSGTAVTASPSTGNYTLYVVDSASVISRVDPSTGASIRVGPTGPFQDGSFGTLTDLAFSPSGELYGTSGAGLYRLDPNTGAATFIGTHGSLPGQVVGLEFGSDGVLYGLTNGNGALVSINTAPVRPRPS